MTERDAADDDVVGSMRQVQFSDCSEHDRQDERCECRPEREPQMGPTSRTAIFIAIQFRLQVTTTKPNSAAVEAPETGGADVRSPGECAMLS